MNRDMFYQNLNQSYQNPGMFVPPSGYNMNSNFQSYGVFPMQNNTQSNLYDTNYNDINDKINKIDKQIRNLDQRVKKLESLNENDDNLYMV